MAIVNISSTGAYRSGTGDAALFLQRQQALGLSRLDEEHGGRMGGQGVRANVVTPGVIDTSMVRIMDDPAAARLG